MGILLVKDLWDAEELYHPVPDIKWTVKLLG